jgi:hypothetical protein
MPRPHTRHGLKPDRRHALEFLAGNRDDCTEAIMLAHGFPVSLLVDLCMSRLATATPERVVAGGRKVEVARVRITEVGRRTLARPKG